MALDLVQIRWQLLRATEANQVIEQENVSLRLEIARLKRELEERVKALDRAPPPQPSSPAVDPKLAQKVMVAVQVHSMKMRTELARLKAFFEGEVSGLAKALQQAHTHQRTCFQLVTNKDHEAITVLRDRQRLQQLLAEAQSDAEKIRQSANDAIAQRDDRLLLLQQQLLDQQNIQEQLRKEWQEQEARRIAEAQEAATLREALVRQQVDSDRLREDLIALQGSTQGALERAAEALRQSEAEGAQRLAVAREEEERLRARLAALEDQVARLSNALVGNRSHFAKYVEVKTENLALQGQLQSLLSGGKLSPRAAPQPQLLPQLPTHQALPQVASHGGVRRSSLSTSEKAAVSPSVDNPALLPRSSFAAFQQNHRSLPTGKSGSTPAMSGGIANKSSKVVI
eukprot:gene1965-2143_t